MKRFTLVFAAMLLEPFLFSPVRTQVKGNLASAISQLLDYPAPPPPPPKDLAEVLAAMKESAIKTGPADPPNPGPDRLLGKSDQRRDWQTAFRESSPTIAAGL